jgi:alpha-L-fucosidase
MLWKRGLRLLPLLLLTLVSVASAQETYEPTQESLNTRPVPEWFQNAKLGIFIHWGAYSVPGWAPLTGELDEVLTENATADGPGWAYWFAHNPYAEWYGNSMKIEGSDTQKYHISTYGADYGYDNFVADFNQAVASWDPNEWADLFADVGARYVVLTTKHHDGVLLWPSDNPNPNRENWQTERDLVGELTTAVRARGMEMGLYYSGGIDWTVVDLTITDFNTLIAAIPQDQAYADYALAHWRELIEKYQPAVLWNDLGFPQVATPDLLQLFADYYSVVPEGVVNDRFGLGQPREAFHNDFHTQEYAELEEIQERTWESTRGMGYSFGYNQLDSEENVLTVDDLVDSFADIVSKNGNLLLNIGPRADGSLPDVYVNVLNGLGSWLDVNGEAIFDTRPWTRAEATTDNGGEVRFTQKDGVLYAILLDAPAGDTITINELVVPEGAVITLLGVEGELSYEQGDAGLTLTLPALGDDLANAPAWSFRITPAPAG